MPPRRVLQANTVPFAFPPISSPPQATGRHSNKDDLALGLGVGCTLGVLLVAVLAGLFFYHRLKIRRTSPYDLSNSKSLQKFSYQQLKKATGSFSEDRKLGQGGFGEVFRGELRNGDEIAVKSVDVSSVQGEVAFQSEISILGQVNSHHIVRLLGFCTHGPRRLLVYEFMAKRNLQEVLFDEVYAVPLDWDLRFRIILNIAEALAYLHFKCDPPVIHGDVKPSNVLLNANFQAKLADFGLARVKTAESILEVQTLEVQRDAIEKERVRYEKIVRDRVRRQKRREDAELKRMEEGALAKAVKGDSMESFAFDPNPEGERRSSASMFDGLSTEEETSGFTLESPCSKGGNNTPTSIVRASDVASESPALANGTNLRSTNDATDTEETSWQDCDETRSYPPSPISTSNEIGTDADADGENFMSAEEGETDVDKSTMSIDGAGEEGWSTVSPSQPDLEFNFEKQQQLQKGDIKANKLRSWSREWWRKQEKDDGSRSQHIQDSDTKSLRSSTIELHRSGELTSEGGETRRPKHRSDYRRQRSKSSGWIGAIVGELSKEAKKKSTPAKGHDKLKGREWWREEYCEELTNKSREFKKGSSMRLDRTRSSSRRHKKDDYTKWIRDFSQEFSAELGHSKNLKSRRESRKSRSRREEFWSGDSAYRGISSTPSMRGTICYVAPESGGAGSTSEKADVYSFGVLLLVLISGRRPLQVNASPLTDFERANLISWARLLAQTGNVLDLVDANLQSAFSDDQVVLCITVALLCLQRLPAARPSMSDIVKILNGELVAPDLPFEFSPSPPGFRSRRKPSSEEIVLERAPLTF